MEVKELIDTLDRHIQNIRKADTPHRTFNAVLDYVDTINSNNISRSITSLMLADENILLGEIANLEDGALKELQIAREVLLSGIANESVEDEYLNKIVSELKDFENGGFVISGVDSENIDSYLMRISQRLRELGYSQLLEKFQTRPGNTIHPIFSDSIESRRKKCSELDRLRKEKIAGCWSYIRLLPFVSKIDHERDFMNSWDREYKRFAQVYGVPLNVDLEPISMMIRLLDLKVERKTKEHLERQRKDLVYMSERLHMYLVGQLKERLPRQWPQWLLPLLRLIGVSV